MICPTCKRRFDAPPKADASEEANSGQRRPFPFCSTRCRMADLGSWLDGSYRIPTATDDQDLDTAPTGDDPPPDSDPLN
ncbi:MAG TPA: DNA gyrase inhibitor YacG [Polyangia bacterium]